MTTSTRWTGGLRASSRSVRPCSIAFADQAAKERFGLLGELAECALQHIALLEFLDIRFGDFAALEQAGEQAGQDAEAVARKPRCDRRASG